MPLRQVVPFQLTLAGATVGIGLGTGSISVLSAASQAVTITAHAASTWSTTTGALTISAAAQLHLTGVGASVWTPGAGAKIVSDTVTGIKIGTATNQLLGFFNATPTAQVAGTVDALAWAVTLGFRAASSNPPLNLGSGTLTAGAVNATTFSGTLSGNATTATTLQTPRAINGVNFDGSAPITVTAAASTLTGTVLNATVVTSSLTSVGILASPHMTTAVVDSGGLTVTLGGIVVTGNSTITGSLGGITTLSATTFSGALSGNATTATTLQTPRAINGVNFDGSAPITVTAAASTLTGTVLNATVVTSSLTSVGILAAPHMTSAVVDSGGLTVTLGGIVVTGNSTITGSLGGITTLSATTFSGALSGNATTATTLQTARAINGVNFDGSAPITVTAAASTLTGTVLNATVVTSSLTSVGILASPHMTSPTVDSGTLTSVAITASGLIAGTAGTTISGGAVSITGNAASTLSATAGGLIVNSTSANLALRTTTTGSITMLMPATYGFSATGAAPASVSGAGTAGGTYWSVTAPNGGASTGAAGGAGASISYTTGDAGASFTGGANAGDLIISLGANSGTTSRSGQVQITATDTSTLGSAVQYNAALMVTQTLTFTTAIASNRQAASFILTTNGDGSNLGAQSVGLSAIESRHVINMTGTVTPLLYGAEFQTIPQGTGTYASITTIQSDTAVFAGNGGTVTGWVGYRHAPGPFNNVTVTVLSGFHAAGYTFLGSDQPIKIHNGFASDWVDASLNHVDTAGSYVQRGVFVPIPRQGGNTTGTNDNIGVHVAVAAIANSGGGLAASGGIVRNRGIVIDMPTAQAVAGANQNYGIDITGTIGGNDAFNATYATHQDIRWNAGAGGTAQLANRWTISANAANSGRLENFRIESTMNSNGNTVAAWWDIVAGAPTYTVGTVTSKIGIVTRNQGNASATSAAGMAVDAQTGATNNTSVLLGTTTIPTGNWTVYSSSALASTLLGALAIGTNNAPSTGLMLNVQGTQPAAATPGTSVGTFAQANAPKGGNTNVVNVAGGIGGDIRWTTGAGGNSIIVGTGTNTGGSAGTYYVTTANGGDASGGSVSNVAGNGGYIRMVTGNAGAGTGGSGGRFRVDLGTGSTVANDGQVNVYVATPQFGNTSNPYFTVNSYGVGVGGGSGTAQQVFAVQSVLTDPTGLAGGNEYIGSNILTTVVLTADSTSKIYAAQFGVFTDTSAFNMTDTVSAVQMSVYGGVTGAKTVNYLRSFDAYPTIQPSSTATYTNLAVGQLHAQHAGTGTVTNMMLFDGEQMLYLGDDLSGTGQGTVTTALGYRSFYGMLGVGTAGSFGTVNLFTADTPNFAVNGTGVATTVNGVLVKAQFNTYNTTAASGTLTATGINVSVPTQTMTGGVSATNTGILIQGVGGAAASGGATVSNFALKSTSTAQTVFQGPIGFGPGVGTARTDSFVVTDISFPGSLGTTYYNYYAISRFSGADTLIVGYNSVAIFSAGTAVTGYSAFRTAVPTFTAGAVTNLIGFDNAASLGNAIITNAVGARLFTQASATTANISLLIGNTIPSGTWSLYSSNAAASSFLGPVAIGSNTAPTAPTTYSLVSTSTLANVAGSTWDGIAVLASTLTLSATTQVTTASGLNLVKFSAPTIAQTGGAVTVNQASTVSISGAPIAGSSVTITNSYALSVASGNSLFNGTVNILPASTSMQGLTMSAFSPSTTGLLVNIVNGDTVTQVQGGQTFPIPVFQVRAYQPSTPTAIQNTALIWSRFPAVLTDGVDAYGLHVRMAGQYTSGNAGMHVARFHFEPGGASQPWADNGAGTNYTGAYGTSAVNAQNDAQGTGVHPLGDGVTVGEQFFTADFGGVNLSQGTSAGWNIGVGGSANGSSAQNWGGVFFAYVAANGARNVGVVGVANNAGTGGAQTAGWFAINTTEPTITTCVLGADNGSSTSPVFLGQVAGATVFQVNASGAVSSAPKAVAGGATSFVWTPPAATAVTSEVFSANFAPNSLTITGGYATQRFWRFGQPQITAGSALTVVTAATVCIDGAPSPQSSAVITNAFALLVSAGVTALGGGATIGAVVAPAAASVFTVTPTATVATGTSAIWNGFSVPATTLTFTGTTAITTATGVNMINIVGPTLSAPSTFNITWASTVAIQGPPVAGGGGPPTFTTGGAISLWVVTGGVVAGAATAGSKGTGTLNVSSGVFLNGTAYTNPGYVFEHWLTGGVTRYADQPRATSYQGLLPLAETERVVRSTYELPGFSTKDDLFRRAAYTLEKTEEAFIHLFAHDKRLVQIQNNQVADADELKRLTQRITDLEQQLTHI